MQEANHYPHHGNAAYNQIHDPSRGEDYYRQSFVKPRREGLAKRNAWGDVDRKMAARGRMVRQEHRQICQRLAVVIALPLAPFWLLFAAFNYPLAEASPGFSPVDWSS